MTPEVNDVEYPDTKNYCGKLFCIGPKLPKPPTSSRFESHYITKRCSSENGQCSDCKPDETEGRENQPKKSIACSNCEAPGDTALTNQGNCPLCGKFAIDLSKWNVGETEGVRQNKGKPMLSPIDPELFLEEGKGIAIGQEKYQDKAFNKEGNVMYLSTGYDSTMRHLLKFMSGEDVDPDDGVHHLAKARNCIAVMWHNRKQGDDR